MQSHKHQTDIEMRPNKTTTTATEKNDEDYDPYKNRNLAKPIT